MHLVLCLRPPSLLPLDAEERELERYIGEDPERWRPHAARFAATREVLARLGAEGLRPGEARELADADAEVLSHHWEALDEGGLRLAGPAFLLEAADVRAAFERARVDGLDARLEELRAQGRLVER